MKLFSKVLFVVVITLAVKQSFAWGTTGHRVVAEIAERHLTKKAKRGVAELIGKEPMAFWANWPDFIRSDTTPKWANTTPWHYINLPSNLSKGDMLHTMQGFKDESLYSQIPIMIAQLKDKTLPLEKRKDALIFLVHFIGDLHQPLHTGHEDDQGGNKITVFWFDKQTNLHTMWDSGLIDYQQYSYTEYATVLDVADKNQQKAILAPSMDDWYYESHQLADKIYALTPPQSKLSYKYNYIFQTDLNNQLLKGGLRLAKILNEAFK